MDPLKNETLKNRWLSGLLTVFILLVVLGCLAVGMRMMFSSGVVVPENREKIADNQGQIKRLERRIQQLEADSTAMRYLMRQHGWVKEVKDGVWQIVPVK